MAAGELLGHTAKPCQLCSALRGSPAAERRQPAARTADRLRIALVDDDEATRLAARKMVRTQPEGWELEIYRPCREGLGPTRAKGSPPAKRREVDVVMIGLPDRDGARLACVRRLKALAPGLPVVVVSGQRDPTLIAWYCMAGADGWLVKPLAAAELARAVRSASQGRAVLCRQAEEALMDFLHQVGKCKSFGGLPERQQEILVCLGASLSNKEIGLRLGISHATVHVQVARLLRKASVHTRQRLVKKLLARGGGAPSNPFVTHICYWLGPARGGVITLLFMAWKWASPVRGAP